jgi:hypothetical protein
MTKVLTAYELNRMIYGSNKFFLVVFFRGNWCKECERYLMEFSTYDKQIREMGGQIVAVCAQSIEEAPKTISQWNLNFSIVSDESNWLARRFGMNITQKSSTVFAEMLNLLRTQNVDVEEKLLPDSVYCEGICQPGILIFRKRGQLIYKWQSQISKNTHYGVKYKVTVSHLVEICRFNFGDYPQNTGTLRSYEMEYMMERMYPHLFEFVLSNTDAKELFYMHLVEEQCSDILQFLDSLYYIRLWTIGEDKSTVIPLLSSTFNDYIHTDAPQAIELPSNIANPLIQAFTNGNPSDISIFDQAENYAKVFLKHNAFKRFLITSRAYHVIQMLSSE